MSNENIYRYLIIGSGFSGIGMAIKLLSKNHKDILILERSSSAGGTWRDNVYPGCACDVESHLYSFSFEKKSNWSRKWAKQSEIREYLDGLYNKYNLASYTKFGETVVEAKFDEYQGLWSVRSEHGTEYKCKYLIPAIGPLSNPKMPDIKGLKDFKGPVFHSAKWDYSVDLTGKSVGVIGTGASTIQFLPEIVNVAKKVNLFQRSAPWIMEKPDREFRRIELLAFRFIPFWVHIYRTYLYVRNELRGMPYFKASSGLLDFAEAQIVNQIKSKISDDTLRNKLIPKFRLGCKRTLLSSNYFDAVSRDNVYVDVSGISQINDRSVCTKDGGDHSVDVLIMGTGFLVDAPLANLNIIGVDGRVLNLEWKKNGFRNYNGCAVEGYPNLLLLAGPNTGVGHTSLIYMIEQQINYALKYIQYCEGNKKKYLDVLLIAQEEYMEMLQEKVRETVWATGCNSWYLTKDGHNFSIWPRPTWKFRSELSNFKESHYKAVDYGSNIRRSAV